MKFAHKTEGFKMKRYKVETQNSKGGWIFKAAFDDAKSAFDFQAQAFGVARVWDNAENREVVSL